MKNQIILIFFDLKGGNLKQFVKENKLKGTNIIEFHIYDSDIGSTKEFQYQKECEEVNNRKDDSFCFLTNKRELENYIPKRLIENKFKINMSEISEEIWDIKDIPTYLINKTKKKEISIKNILNGELSKQITKKDLEELNAFDEVEGWFLKIKELSQK